jgi:large subunit ribosomal protein L21e
MWAPAADVARALRLAKAGTTWASDIQYSARELLRLSDDHIHQPLHLSQWVTQPVSARVRAMRECTAEIECDSSDGMQLLEGLQKEGNDPALDLPQAVQGRRHRRCRSQRYETPAARNCGRRLTATGAVQKGMPYKVYHGKTGIVYNVTKSAVGVILQKQVGNRYMEKRINVRIEHVRHSRSREDFLKRVKANFALQQKAKETGEPQQLKRVPKQPRTAHTVSLTDNKPENITPVPYETTI